MKPQRMRRKRLGVLIAALILSGIMGVLIVRLLSESQIASATTPPTGPDLPYREAGADGIESPDISFIDSPDATCLRPVSGTNACYIQWSYLYVTASPSQYVISMTVTIDDQLRSYHSGFFQTFMYIPGDMIAPGYKVSCGALGSGGTPGWGQTYNYTIRARETGGLKAANYGAVTCPADVIQLYLPLIKKK